MPESTLATSLRSHQCGAVRVEHVGQPVWLGGTVHRARLVFLDLRHRAGLVPIVPPNDLEPLHIKLES